MTSDYGVDLIDAWPSIVGEVALGHSLGGDSLKLPVTFQFRKWHSTSSTSSSSGSRGNWNSHTNIPCGGGPALAHH